MVPEPKFKIGEEVTLCWDPQTMSDYGIPHEDLIQLNGKRFIIENIESYRYQRKTHGYKLSHNREIMYWTWPVWMLKKDCPWFNKHKQRMLDA